MGWFYDDLPGHEGYISGQTREDGRWVDVDPPQGFRGALPVAAIQAVCECGWRSSRYRAPWGTTWAPRSIDLPAGSLGLQAEEACRRLWLQHMTATRETAQTEIGTLGEPVIDW